MNDLNFSSTIKELSTIQNLSPETEKRIIILIKEKAKNPQIDALNTTNLKDFINQIPSILTNDSEKEYTDEERQQIKDFLHIKISDAEIFPNEINNKEKEITNIDFKKILLLQLSQKEQKEKELSYQVKENLTNPLERSFNNQYHLLKECKYPLSEEEREKYPKEVQKPLKELQTKINEEEAKENPDIQKLRNRIQEYQYLQLPKDQEQIKKFLTENRKEETRIQECRENQNLLTQIAESTAEDLLHSTLFSQTFKTPEQQSDFKTFCKNLLNIEKSEIEIPTCEGKKHIKLQRHWNIKNKKI